MARVVFLAGESDWLGSALRTVAGDRPYAFLDRDSSGEAMSDALSDAHALIARPDEAAILWQTCPDLQFVQFTTCGFDQQVLTDLHGHGIPVSGLGGVLAGDVAQIALGLFLAIDSGASNVIKPSDPAWQPSIDKLRGRACGILGLGLVGTAMARLLLSAGARVTYADVRTAPRPVVAELHIRRSTQDRLLVDSELVSVHVPLTEQTKASIGRRELSLLGGGSALVNTSSPAVVDRQALIRSLREERVKGYGTTDLDPGLAGLPGVAMADPKLLQTPEIAERVAAWIVRNVDAALEGRRPHGLVETIGFPRAGDPSFWSSQMAAREVVP